MRVIRYKGQPLPFTISFNGNPLQPYNKDYSDIQDISINFKKDKKKDADDKYLEHLQSSGGVILDTSANSFTFIPQDGDYDKLDKGEYFIVLAVKVNGFTDMIELSDSHILNVTEDSQRK